MTRFLQTALLCSLLPLAGSFTAQAADLDYSYAPPPPPPRYERPVVIEERPVVVERPVIYPRPYPFYRPYPRFVRRLPPPFYGPYRRFAYGPRFAGPYGYRGY